MANKPQFRYKTTKYNSRRAKCKNRINRVIVIILIYLGINGNLGIGGILHGKENERNNYHINTSPISLEWITYDLEDGSISLPSDWSIFNERGEKAIEALAGESSLQTLIRANGTYTNLVFTLKLSRGPFDLISFEVMDADNEDTISMIKEFAEICLTNLAAERKKIMPIETKIAGVRGVRFGCTRPSFREKSRQRTIYTYFLPFAGHIYWLTVGYEQDLAYHWEPILDRILNTLKLPSTQADSSTFDVVYLIISIIFQFVISFILTWIIGLAIPLLIRFIIWGKPISKVPAILITILCFFANIYIFVGLLNSQNKTHLAIFLVAIVSYFILHKGYNKKH